MRFHNPTDKHQRFTLGTRTYDVPKGANVDLPDHLTYVVKSRGMVLREGPAPEADAPVAAVAEALPPRAEVLLASPRLSPRQRESFRSTYALAGKTDRARMIEELEGIAEGKGVLGGRRGGEDDDLVDGQPQGAPDDADASVDAQLDGAAAVVGKGRRAKG